MKAMLLWVFTHTNLRILGGYTSLRTWKSVSSVIEDAWLAGWGLALFDQTGPPGNPFMTFFQYDTVEVVNPATNEVLEKKAVRLTDGGWRGFDGSEFRAISYNPARPHSSVVDRETHLKMVVKVTTQTGDLIKHHSTSGMGSSDAESYMRNAMSVLPHLSRFVLYVDNESPPPANADFDFLLDYYKGFYSWLETQPAGTVTMRPGIYAHLEVLGNLLKEFPYLYVVDDNYWGAGAGGKNLDSKSLNPRPPSGLRREFVSSTNNAIPFPSTYQRNLVKAASTGTRGPKWDWLIWPTVWQWQGDNTAPLTNTPRAEKVDSFPIQFNPPRAQTWKVDYESALVDDPAYPNVSPRIAAISNGSAFCVVRLDRISNGAADGRCGTIFAFRISSGATPSWVPLTYSWPYNSYSPDIRPFWLASPKGQVLTTARRDNWNLLLSTQEWMPTGLEPRHSNVLSAGGPTSIHSRVAGAAYDDDHAGILTALPTGELYVTQTERQSNQWLAPRLIDSKTPRLVHPYSQLVASSRRGSSLDAFFIDGARVLHTARLDSNGWSHQAIDTDYDRLLPTTAISACSPRPDAIFVTGVGYDLKLNVFNWTSKGGNRWMQPYEIGANTDLLCAHTDLAAAWNPITRNVEVLATANDATLCWYDLHENPQTSKWELAGSRILIGSPSDSIVRSMPKVQRQGGTMFGNVAPNPFGDLILNFLNKGQRLIGAVFNFAPGFSEPAVLVSHAGYMPPGPGGQPPAWTLLR